MRHLVLALFILSVPLFTYSAKAVSAKKAGHSKYVGQEERAIKSLSADDIAELKRGGGWGLAKAAELNGVPGPAHLLELKEKIPLSKVQIEKISKIYNSMKSQAIKLGNQLISLEKELETQFQTNTIDQTSLKTSLSEIANVKSELRYVHLSTHLETSKILSKNQITKYNALRGYSNSNPCEVAPIGHDLALWRKHNGCK